MHYLVFIFHIQNKVMEHLFSQFNGFCVYIRMKTHNICIPDFTVDIKFYNCIYPE